MKNLFFIYLWLEGTSLWLAPAVFQDKLLEEMWKQQDSLEGPTGTAAEMPAAPEAGQGSEETAKDSNPLLQQLRALEVKWIAWSTPPHTLPTVLHFSPPPFPHPWNVALIDILRVLLITWDVLY